MTRLFKFMNNFLSDEMQSVPADYGVFGYFDGLSMEVYKDEDEEELLKVFSDPFLAGISDEKLFAPCDYYNLLGIYQGESDAGFWEKGRSPFIFVSCLRLAKRTDALHCIVEKLEKTYEAVCYTTIDSGDLIVCIRTKSYAEGYRHIEEYRSIVRDSDPDNYLQKGFSFCLVSQAVLDVLAECASGIWSSDEINLAQQEIALIDQEGLNCSFYCIVKDWDKINIFCDELQKRTGIKTEIYGILGSEDARLEMCGIGNKKLLSLFGRDQILTHGNASFYKPAFYNVRTEIMVQI